MKYGTYSIHINAMLKDCVRDHIKKYWDVGQLFVKYCLENNFLIDPYAFKKYNYDDIVTQTLKFNESEVNNEWPCRNDIQNKYGYFFFFPYIL